MVQTIYNSLVLIFHANLLWFSSFSNFDKLYVSEYFYATYVVLDQSKGEKELINKSLLNCLNKYRSTWGRSSNPGAQNCKLWYLWPYRGKWLLKKVDLLSSQIWITINLDMQTKKGWKYRLCHTGLLLQATTGRFTLPWSCVTHVL